MKSLYDFNYEQIQQYALSKGWKKYRGHQIFQWLYRKRVTSIDDMSDLSKETREILNQEFIISPLGLKDIQIAKDGTTKFLFELLDGALIESVLMIFDYGNSVCVTTQVGCNMGCAFCASGLTKKQRDLTSGEIVAQIMYVQGYLDQREQRLSHIVVMGTGEPFDNYEEMMNALATVNHDRGLGIGARHITISTCGVVPKIYAFAKEHVQYNLAISLHAPNDELRNQLMPINHAYPLAELFQAIHAYCDENNRRLTFEYILLKGQELVEKDGYQTQLISGIPSFCAAAARMNIPLALWNEQIHILPAVHNLSETLPDSGTCILMKSGSKMSQVKEILKRSGREAVMIENCGTSNEHVYLHVDDIPDTAGYYSLIISKEAEQL